jgi:hypothetical protein
MGRARRRTKSLSTSSVPRSVVGCTAATACALSSTMSSWYASPLVTRWSPLFDSPCLAWAALLRFQPPAWAALLRFQPPARALSGPAWPARASLPPAVLYLFQFFEQVAPKFNDAKMKAALIEAAEFLSLQPTEAETETRFRRTVQSFGGELPNPCTDGERNTTRSSTPATPKESSPTPELGAATEDRCYDKCYECKFGRFALRKNSPKQCRSELDSAVKGAMGHTACNWQDDDRTAAIMTELKAAGKK